MNSYQINIKGMHCRSCEILIEDELVKIPGVEKAEVNHAKGVAQVYCQNDIDNAAVESAVCNAGYSLGTDEKPLIALNSKTYQELGLAFLLSMTLFLIAKNLGILQIGSGIANNYSSFTTVFLVGLTAGISTCMALVGGMVLGASAKYAKKHPEASAFEKFKPHLLFNLGRIISYFFFGALIGLLGSFFQLSTLMLGSLTIIVGGVMLVLGGQLLDISPALNSLSFSLPKGISRLIGLKEKTNDEYSDKNAVVMGAMTFFLPCGFTQAMQLFAMSTGDPITASLTMGIFALGTAPGLLGVGGLTSLVKGAFARIFFRTVGIIVILLALFNIQNGFNLTGFQFSAIEPALAEVLGVATDKTSISNFPINTNLNLVNGVQEVRMRQGSYGYSPNSFTIKKGIPVKWIITSENTNTCAASIVSQQLGIRQGLQLGDNVFEFTPEQTGTIRFSCLMGMFTGTFNVVDDSIGQNNFVNSVASSTPTPTTAPVANGGSCGIKGGCGCGGGKKADTIAPQIGNVTNVGETQILKATYSVTRDIVPNQFTVNANQAVRLEIEAVEDGSGCMGSVALPGLSNKVEVLSRGKTVTFDFIPTKAGVFNITCAMGVPRGQIIVN